MEKKNKAQVASTAKYISLMVLTLQNVSLVVMIRYAKIHSEPFISSTLVVAAEVLKIMLNSTLEFVYSDERHLFFTNMYRSILTVDVLKMGVPALLYVIQNNLIYVALSNLSVPVYQVTIQGKLLTTALISKLLLDREFSGIQYLSLIALGVGVAIVQIGGTEDSSNNSNSAASSQSQLLGLIAVFICCLTSGFAGVYFEKVLKSSRSVSVYVRNVHLASWSVLLALVPVFTKDLEKIEENGFFQGYDALVVGVVINQSLGGLIVSYVIKYADNVLKGFSISIAIVVATLISYFLMDTHLSYMFGLGCLLVLFATLLYTLNPKTYLSDMIDKLMNASKRKSKLEYVELEKQPDLVSER